MTEPQTIDRASLRPLCKNAPDHALDLLAHECQRRNLDPFTGQIYLVNRKDRGQDRWKVETSVAGLLTIASRTGRYLGKTEAFWCAADGKWQDFWTSDQPPAMAKVGVHVMAADHPTWGQARWQSYFVPNSFTWGKMPETMLAKCALAQALRAAFPEELSGLYAAEEMEQAGNNRQQGQAPSNNGADREPGQDPDEPPGLFQQIDELEDQAVAEGIMTPGELLAHILEGKRTGACLNDDPDTWPIEVIPAVLARAQRFITGCRERAPKRAAALKQMQANQAPEVPF
jgi:phage recombination protein Bet